MKLIFNGKLANKIILTIVVLAMAFSPLNVLADNHTESLELKDLLPQYNNYKWMYHGSVEYGHDMEIQSIVSDQNTTHYHIQGYVHDMSDGESVMDFSLAWSIWFNLM